MHARVYACMCVRMCGRCASHRRADADAAPVHTSSCMCVHMHVRTPPTGEPVPMLLTERDAFEMHLRTCVCIYTGEPMPMLLAVFTLLLMAWLAISIMWLLIRHEREAVKRVRILVCILICICILMWAS